MAIQHLANATDIEQWADSMASRSDLPELVRRLVIASSNPQRADFRAQRGTGLGGWDGLVETTSGNLFVPEGKSGWEMGTGKDPQGKATDDFAKRTKDPSPFDSCETSFVFVTPRHFDGKEKWVEKKQKSSSWKGVTVIDVDGLATWLSEHPGVHVWFSQLIGKPVTHVQDLRSWWQNWSVVTAPPVSSALLLGGRNDQAEQIKSLLNAPGAHTIQAESPDEARAFLAATIESIDDELTCQDTWNRALIVEDGGAWRFFAAQRDPLILIPSFHDSTLFQEAVGNGHCVILPVGPEYASSTTVSLHRLSSVIAQDQLKAAGLSTVEARHAAALARRSLTAYRRVRANTPLELPDWANGIDGPTLVPLLLAGQWNQSSEGDRKSIERLSGQPYKEVKANLMKWRSHSDAPFRLVGDLWMTNAKEDTWRLLAKHVTAEELRLFCEVSEEVLLEQDPQRGMDFGEKVLADVEGKQRKYSTSLRTGIADSLALLGALGSDSDVQTGDASDVAQYAANCVRQILSEAFASPKILLDLAPHLKSLAEAAPDVFLELVEKDLANDDPGTLVLFEGESGLMSTNYDYPQLLWALEYLAWSPKYFPRVAMVLATLASVAPATEIVNSPLGSLHSFFRLWLPQCGAGPELRLQALDSIRTKHPEIGWRLLIDLLPSGHDSAMVLSGPGARAVLWRDWISEATHPSQQELWESFKAVSERLLEDVEIDPQRWLVLLDEVTDLAPPSQDEAVSKLKQFVGNTGDSELKIQIWEKLRSIVARHTAFEEADWAMPIDIRTELEQLLAEIEPKDPVERNMWLFQQHPQLKTRGRTWDEVRVERTKAVSEVLRFHGVDGLKQLAQNTEVPGEIGVALAHGNDSDSYMSFVLDCLDDEDERLQLLARGYIVATSRKRGTAWIATHFNVDKLNEFSPQARLSVLLSLPSDEKTLDLVDATDSETQSAFWKATPYFWTDDEVTYRRVIEALLKHEQPRAALDSLAMKTNGEESWITPTMVQRALHASLLTPVENDPWRTSAYDLKRLFGYLKNHPDSDKETLVSLEWAYLPFMRHESTRLMQHEQLEENPSFFVKIVGMSFKTDDGITPDGIDPENAQRAFHLLDRWRRVPGMEDNDSLNSKYFEEWVAQALELLEEAKLKNGGMLALGKMLRWGPSEKNGIWPAPEICDVIQDIASDVLDAEFQVAIYNSRGVTSRGPYSGGGQERALADKYESYSDKLEAKWPRVAAIMRKMAAGYSNEAKRHDIDAELSEDTLG